MIENGVSHFLFLNGASAIYHVHGNIGQRNYGLVNEQLAKHIGKVKEDLWKNAWFLLVVDNAKQHHKALRSMTNDWIYYAPASSEQSKLLQDEVEVIPFDPNSNSGSKSPAQL